MKINSVLKPFPFKLFLSLFLLLVGRSGFAQTAASYSFSTAGTTYTPISGGTVLSSGSGMDDASFSVTIPSFTFLGIAYTQVYASENGFIQFGATSPTGGMRTGYLSTADGAARTGVSAFCRDIRGKSGSELRMQHIGSEIVFQWTDMTNFGSTAQTYTFQIRLNTVSNEIRVVYKELTVTSTFSTPNQVGLRGSLTDYNNRATTTNWASSTAGTSNTAAMTVSATVFPASGLAYIWTPPSPCTGKPAGGTLASSAGSSLVCAGASVNLTVTGATLTTGIVYAWDVSTVSATGPWTVVAGETAASYTVAAPACANQYYRRRTICSLSGLFDSSNAVQLRTSCLVPPYFENFESISTANEMPNCLSATNVGSRVYTYLNGTTYNRINHTPGGSKFAAFRWSSNDFIYTPSITLTAGKMYEFSFWYTTDGNSGWDSLYALSGASKTSLSILGKPLTNLTNMDYRKFSAAFVASVSGEQVFAIKCASNSSPWYLSIDDISVQEVPPCSGAPVTGVPSAIPAPVCTIGETELDLPDLTLAAGYTFEWQDSTVGGTWGTGAGRPSFGGNKIPFKTGTFGTTTYFRCIVTCSTSGMQTTSPVLRVKAGPYEVPYFEDFESITTANELPNCLTATNVGTMVTTYLSPDTYNRINHTPGGSQFAAFRYSSDDLIYTPPIRLTAGKTYAFSFWYTTDGLSGWDSLYALSGNSKTSLSIIGRPLSALTNKDYRQFIATFVATASAEQIFAIKCKAMISPWYLSIDDIALQEVPPCDGIPVTGMPSLNPARICTIGATELDLPDLPLAKGYAYEWQDSTAGGTWGNDLTRPTFGGNKIPFKTGSFDVTTYFRCIVTCTYSGLKTISPVQKVMAGPSEMPYFEDFESITNANEFPACMTASSPGSIVLSYTASDSRNRMNHTPGGSKFAAFRWSANDYLFSPALKFEAGYEYIISFWYITDGLSGWTSLGVKLGATPDATGMTTTLKTIGNARNTVYNQYLDTFTAPSSGIYYFGINCTATSAPWYLSFDDIGIQLRPCYSMPASGTISASVPSGAGVCAGQRTTLVTTGATTTAVGGIRYQWQRRDLTATGATWTTVAGADSNVLSADSLGGYEYRMAVVCTHTNDSSFTAAYALPLLPAHPSIEISPLTTPVSFCLGDTVKLSATDYVGSIYDWMLSDSTIIPGWKFSDFGATEPGTYMARASSPGLPCPAYTSQVTLNVNDPGYSVILGVSSDTFICEGNTVALTASGSKAGLTYQWTKNNVDIPFARSTFFLAKETGSYRIEAFDGVSLCPAASRSIRIEVRPTPVAVLRVPGGTTTACADEGVLLKASAGAYSYEWLRGGLTVVDMNDSSELIQNAGRYRVKVRSADGCISLSNEIAVNILPSPVPLISRSGTTIGTSFYPSYYWIRNGKDTVSVAQSFTATLAGLYRVVVRDVNGCSGASDPVELYGEGLSIEEATEQGELMIYPNPSTGIVSVKGSVVPDVTVRDVTGKFIMSVKAARSIDLGHYPDGQYIFILSTDDQVIGQQRITKMSGK